MLVVLIAAAALNSLFESSAFMNLEFVTRWFQLLILASIATRSKTCLAVTAVVGILVLIHHWGLVGIGLRDAPQKDTILDQILTYSALPILTAVFAAKIGAFRTPLRQSIPALVTFLLIYLLIVTVQKSVSDTPAYDLPPGMFHLLFAASTVLAIGGLYGLQKIDPARVWLPQLQ